MNLFLGELTYYFYSVYDRSSKHEEVEKQTYLHVSLLDALLDVTGCRCRLS